MYVIVTSSKIIQVPRTQYPDQNKRLTVLFLHQQGSCRCSGRTETATAATVPSATSAIDGRTIWTVGYR